MLQKRDFIALGVIVGGLTVLALWGIFTVTPPDHISNETLLVFGLLAIPCAAIAAFWPLGVWRQEAPERRGYFWSLPVARGPHTLTRFGAGWVLLMLACLTMMALTWALLMVAELRMGPAPWSMARWYVPLATATLAYLLVSSLAVAFDGPVRVLAWTGVTVLGLRIVAQVVRLRTLGGLIDGVVKSLGLALAGPIDPHMGPEVVLNSTAVTIGYATWSVNYLIWFGLGAAALLLVSYRYMESR
jgi:hypothetical protein